MKRTVFFGILVAVLATLFISGAVTKLHAAPPACNLSDLQGSYGYVGQGAQVTSTFTSFVAVFGILGFDGTGRVSGSFNLANSSGVTSVASGSYSGSYSVNPDCSGSLTLLTIGGTSVFFADIVIVENGHEFLFYSPNGTATVSPSIVSGSGKKQ